VPERFDRGSSQGIWIVKPAPDPYLRAAELLGSKRPLVVEDSPAGIASAKAAGFAFVQVPSVGEMASAVRNKVRTS
jgi:HAD superfamily hydrolase (TIGR01509 family)